MNEYMVTITLPLYPDEKFISLIPGHRAHVNELMQRGVILSYALSEDRRTLWIIILASEKDAVIKTLRGSTAALSVYAS